MASAHLVPNQQRSTLEYKSERDIVFVFGAGASVSDGAPLQQQLLPIIKNVLEGELAGAESVRLFMEFLQENFDLSGNSFPSLESIFGYIDYFLAKKESLGGTFSTHRISVIRDTFVRLIHYVIDKHSKETRGIYRNFWEKISIGSRNVSVVTMNYDTILDEAFDILYARKALIDYCIELMNYHGNSLTRQFPWWSWDNPRGKVNIWDGKVPAPIKLIKIHGSLNWKFCNCCNQVLLTPWETDIDMPTESFKGRIPPSIENFDGEEFDLLCPLDGTKFDTFIVPPSHIKQLSHPTINMLLDEAAMEIRVAKRLVFVGYSFPEADVHIKALFKKNLRFPIPIIVVNPFLTPEIERNYRSLGSNCKFVPKTFDSFIEEDLESLVLECEI